MQKQILRDTIKEKLKNISDEQITQNSENIFLQLSEKINKFQTRFIYLAIDKEIQTEKIITFLRQRWKTVLVPKILWNNEMIATEYKPDSLLDKWLYWIMEVKNWKEFLWEIEVAIVPWLAFTKEWKRLWRGKWYYDKFLWRNKKVYKIWICMPEQIVENIPVDEHDVMMDEVLFPKSST